LLIPIKVFQPALVKSLVVFKNFLNSFIKTENTIFLLTFSLHCLHVLQLLTVLNAFVAKINNKLNFFPTWQKMCVSYVFSFYVKQCNFGTLTTMPSPAVDILCIAIQGGCGPD
jgi:hypothetical protein